MDQFDVFPNPNAASGGETPFVVVVQSEPSMGGHTIIVAPLARRVDADADDRIVIPVIVAGEAFVVLLQGLAAIPRTALTKPVGRLPELRDRIALAIDFLFLGI